MMEKYYSYYASKNVDIIYRGSMNGTLNLILNKIENIHSIYLIYVL